jgi:hypothetical protein
MISLKSRVFNLVRNIAYNLNKVSRLALQSKQHRPNQNPHSQNHRPTRGPSVPLVSFRGGSATVDIRHARPIQAACERILILLQLVCRAGVLDIAGLETARWGADRAVGVGRGAAACFDCGLRCEGEVGGGVGAGVWGAAGRFVGLAACGGVVHFFILFFLFFCE